MMVYSYAMCSSDVAAHQNSAGGSDCDVAVRSRFNRKAGNAFMLGALLLAGALCAVGLMPGRARAQTAASASVMGADPTAMVKAVIDEATAVVRDTQTPTAERDERLREIAAANFDFADMARTTLGYHWRTLTPAQRAEFVPLFASFMENVYLSKLQEYSVQKIRQTATSTAVSYTGQQYDGTDYAEVHSTVLLKGQPPPIKVDYLVRRDGASWKIYDLNIDAISVMANYRQQFNRVLNNDGYPALVNMLKKKIAELGSTLDK
jgi:phospholipid transport system substrate-binding protein